MQLPFDIDDISFGPSFFIVAKGQKRFRIDGASKQDLDELRQNWREDPDISGKLREIFLEFGIKYSQKNIRNTELFYIKSRTIAGIAKYFTCIAGVNAFIIFNLISILTPIYIIYDIYKLKKIENFYFSDFVMELVCSLITFFASLFVHEMGHATSCLRASNAVGGVRVSMSRGLIILATDVTSAMQCSRSAKAMTAAMGPIWQCAFAALLLFMSQFGLLSSNIAIFSAFIVIWAGYMSVIPSSGNDGYFILMDLYNSNLNEKFLIKNKIFSYFFNYFRIIFNIIFIYIFLLLINKIWIPL